jgi:hypothetical protein
MAGIKDIANIGAVVAFYVLLVLHSILPHHHHHHHEDHHAGHHSTHHHFAPQLSDADPCHVHSSGTHPHSETQTCRELVAEQKTISSQSKTQESFCHGGVHVYMTPFPVPLPLYRPAANLAVKGSFALSITGRGPPLA